MRSDYVEIHVDPDLLTQVLRELLALSTDPNYVEVADGDNGRIILAHQEVANEWFDIVNRPEPLDADEFEELASEEVDVTSIANGDTPVAPVPIKRGPGRPRKVVTPPLSEEIL